MLEIERIRKPIAIKIIASLELIFTILLFLLLFYLGIFEFGFKDFDSIVLMLFNVIFIFHSMDLLLAEKWNIGFQFLIIPIVLVTIYRLIVWINTPNLGLAWVLPFLAMMLIGPIIFLYFCALWYLYRETKSSKLNQ